MAEQENKLREEIEKLATKKEDLTDAEQQKIKDWFEKQDSKTQCDFVVGTDNLRPDVLGILEFKDLSKDNALKIVKKYPLVLGGILNKLNEDDEKDVVLEAVRVDGEALAQATDFVNNKKVVSEAVKNNGLALTHASEDLKKDKKLVTAAVKQNGLALQYADDSFKKDKKVVTAAVKSDGSALQFADDSLKKKKKIVLKAVKQNGLALEYASDDLIKDLEVVSAAVEQTVEALKFVSVEYLNNHNDFIYKAMKKDIKAAKYIPEGVSERNNIVSSAVRKSIDKYDEIVPDDLKGDSEFNQALADSVKERYNQLIDSGAPLSVIVASLEDIFKILDKADGTGEQSKEFAEKLVSENGNIIKHFPDSLKKNKDIVLAAVKQNGLALQYVDSNVEGYEDVVLEAVGQNGLALQYASDDLKDDIDVVKNAVSNNGLAIQFASEKCRGARNIVMSAVENTPAVLDLKDEVIISTIKSIKFATDFKEKFKGNVKQFKGTKNYKLIGKEGRKNFVDKILGLFGKGKGKEASDDELAAE